LFNIFLFFAMALLFLSLNGACAREGTVRYLVGEVEVLLDPGGGFRSERAVT
jgi:hypothetical protein